MYALFSIQILLVYSLAQELEYHTFLLRNIYQHQSWKYP
jgi:hypothetical protein